MILLPAFSYSAVYINEIMYNPEGSDSGYEWIEICNSAESEEPVLDLKLLENDVRHSVNLAQGDGILAEDACAIIADKPDKFKEKYPNYSGTILDSSFSLSNSGEEIAILKLEQTLDRVSYTSDMGANGDGQSLHRNGDVLVPASPTPGNKTLGEQELAMQEDNSSTGNENSEAEPYKNITELPIYKYKLVEIEPPQDIFLRLPEEINLHNLEYFDFPLELFDARGSLVQGAVFKVYWGDGEKDEATDKAFFRHFYKNPGTYIISVSAYKNGLSDQRLAKLHVKDFNLGFYLDEAKRMLLIENKSDLNMNLEGWKLKVRTRIHNFDKIFIAPKNLLRLYLDDLFQVRISDFRDIILLSPDRSVSLKVENYLKDSSSDVKSKESGKEINQEPVGENSSQASDITSKKDETDKTEIKPLAYSSTKRAAKKDEKTEPRESILGYELNFQNKKAQKGTVQSAAIYTIENMEAPGEKYTEKNERVLAGAEKSFDFSWLWASLSLLLFSISIIFIYNLNKDDFEDWEFEEG